MNRYHEGLRLALLNPINPDHPIAERELALRLARSIGNMGWEARIVSRVEQVEAMDPDAVLCLHPQATAKLSSHPWLACYWNPSSLLDGASAVARANGTAAELSYDAYLVSGSILHAHLGSLMRRVRREPPVMPFHVSSPRSTLISNFGPHSRLFYVGSNWDGRRYPTLLRTLSDAGILALYGTQERWSHLPDAYHGALPFDGSSVINTAHQWGMGLCLHLPQHRAEGVPNMRVFELAAAGALILADRHPFIEEHFGDSVLYVDMAGGEEAVAAAILDQIAWARSHVRQAQEMAVTAQTIFNSSLCLESLLSPLPDLLAHLSSPSPSPVRRHVGVLLAGGEDLHGRLQQLAVQSSAVPNLFLTALVCQDAPLDLVQPAGVRVCRLGEAVGMEALLAALEGMDGLALLPDAIMWYPDHLKRLITMTKQGGATIAAALWPIPAEPSGFPIDPAEDLALALPDECCISDERWQAWVTLRAGGLYCIRDRLLGLTVEAHDWSSLMLQLPFALASSGPVDLQPVPSLVQVRLPSRSVGSVPPRPMRRVEHVVEAEAKPPRFAGISDLDTPLASSIPFLWKPSDFNRLPPIGAIWLYGMGQGGEIVLNGLPPEARARVAGFLDSSREGEHHCLPLRRVGDIKPSELAASTIIISAQYVSEIIRTLRRNSIYPAHIFNAYPYISAIQEG